MIVDLILDDHQAAREIFAVAGNAPQPSDDERAEEFRRFATLWAAHGAMMAEVIYPHTLEATGRGDIVEPARALQQQVAAMVADLAARAPVGHDHGPWLADFERLKAAFERECDLEDMGIVPLLRSLPPERIARLSREGRDIREARLAGTPSAERT